MKNSLILVLLTCSLAAGCAEPPLVIGQPVVSNGNQPVVIYYIDKPSCNFETLA